MDKVDLVNVTSHATALLFFMMFGLTTPVMAAAQEEKPTMTGFEMLRACGLLDGLISGQSTSPPLNVDVPTMDKCIGEIEGVKFLANAATKNTDNPICVPNNVSSGQALSVVVKHLRGHPETLHTNFLLLIMDAFVDAWPCSRDGGK